MENQNNNKIFIGIIIGLIIGGLVSGVITYLCLSNKNTDKDVVENNDSVETETNTKTDSYQVLELAPIGGIAVMYNGEVYVNVYDSTPNIDDIYGVGKYQTLIQTRNNYQEYSFGNLTVTTKYINVGGSGKWLKLNVSNVKSIHNNEYGQALESTNPKYGIVMINSDNTVSYIGIDNLINGNTNPTKLDVTGISNVVTEDIMGYTTYLVKSDGTKTNVNTLIK